MPDIPTPTDVRFEHLARSLGIGQEAPRISWINPVGGRPLAQASVEFLITGDGLKEPVLRRVDTSDSVLVPWPADPLRSRDRRTVSLRVFDKSGLSSEWSEPVNVEAGLLNRGDWIAGMVGPPAGTSGNLPLLRRDFDVAATIRRARLYVTAHGVYDVEINGELISEDVLAPGWQAYRHRVKYQTYDVTAALRSGANALGLRLADGWYRGRLGFVEQRAIYGDDLGVRAQLELTYDNNEKVVIATDNTWSWTPGPIIESDLYDGETYDATEEIAGWSTSSAAGDWHPVDIYPDDGAALVAPTGPSVRPTLELPPTRIFQSPAGKTLVDFGQNLVGYVRLTVEGPRGHTITIRHAEVLENGELGVRPLRTAKATDQYRLRGQGKETWNPSFTFHGFRYVEVDGWPQASIDPSAITAVVVHTDMEQTGWFSTSDPLLQRLHENVVWSMRGNFVDVPTDCPQRDERLGWTGDIAAFAPTAAFLFDCAGMLESWLQDLSAEQGDDGLVPFFIPDVPFPPHVTDIPGYAHSHAAAWGDAAVSVPSALYAAYGDSQILAAQYSSMRAWVDGVAAIAGPDRVWDSGFQFGDWLDPTAPPESPGDAATDKYLVATAYFARSTRLLAEAARVLGYDEDYSVYTQLADEIVAAFQARYAQDGVLSSDTQTAYALALCFGLLDDRHVEAAGQRLIQLVRAAGHTIATGFVGTPLILDALVIAGGLDDAYQLLLQTECPSWLYTVKQGGTTIWERWDSMLPDGRINPGEMTSFNHYALGAVADWIHRTVGGLSSAAPGYRRILIAPRPGGGLTRASVSHRTPYGLASVEWEISDSGLNVRASVPSGVTATVDLQGELVFEVGAGDYVWLIPIETAMARQRM